MTTYSEKLRDPRWQKKRLEILERDGFQCALCCSGDKTLHVHHGYYRRAAAPWEYEGETLHSLCEDCHEHESDRLSRLHRLIAEHTGSDLEVLSDILTRYANRIPELGYLLLVRLSPESLQ